MPNRRSILKTLLVAPFAPLANWFAKSKRSDRVRMIEVDIGPEMGYLMQGINDKPKSLLTDRPLDQMFWDRWCHEVDRHEIIAMGHFTSFSKLSIESRYPEIPKGWRRESYTITSTPIHGHPVVNFVVEVRAWEVRCENEITENLQAAWDEMEIDCGNEPKPVPEIEAEIRRLHGDYRARSYRRYRPGLQLV